MNFRVVQYTLKIKLLLDKCFYLENLDQNKLNIFLDKLLKQVSHKSTESTLITHPIFTEWITQAIAIWSSDKKNTPPTNIAAFTLNLGSILSQNEEKFCILNNNNFFIKLVNVLKARQREVAPSVKLAYIKLLASFLEHKSGVEWMIGSNFWEDILQMCLTVQGEQITKESRLFIIKLLKETIDQDENFCHNIVQKIMLSLEGNVYKSGEASEEVRLRQMGVVLKLISNILKKFMESKEKDFRIAFTFWENYNLKKIIADIMVKAQNTPIKFELEKIMFIVQFFELYKNVKSKAITTVDIKNCIQKIKNTFMSKITENHFDNVLKFSSFGYFYWHLMSSEIPSVEENLMSYEFLVIQVLPPGSLIIKYCYSIPEMEELLLEDIFRDIFFNKVLKLMSESTVRMAYAWRDFLLSQSNLFNYATKSLIHVLKSKQYYSFELAVILFQDLLYILKDFLAATKKNPQIFEFFFTQIDCFSLIFEIIAFLIQEFHFTWRNSVEVVDVMAVTFDILTIPMCPLKLMMKALNLLKIAIAEYMTPNLTLLVDNINDTTIALLGPLLSAKLHDETWDVKNLALEIIWTMLRVSNNKFPSLQKVLMDSELPTLVVKMSTCDGESFVRATAIKCLQEMIQVEEIWNNILKAEDLPLKMRDILLNETEGIVRVEAATFMCIAYENQQFQPETLDTIYETMIYSSTTDLHWEVKVRALGFWDKVIKNNLQNQGMIDGSFPNVTFSKEHRKIVTLTDAEIRKRLQKVLNQLSSIGCLGVLVSAIKDDCDMEVSKTAVKITQSLVDLFKKYNVYGDLGAPTSPLPVENGVSSSVSMSSGISVDESMDSPNNFFNSDFTDEIINEIVNSKDVSLLKNVYSPSDYGSVVNYDFQVRKIISPNEFLQFTQQDLNNVIAEKKNWLNGIEDLGSLLDDMLKTYDDDVNNMDCY